MPQYKVTYFDARGRAEISRLILAYKGIEFEDERISREDWPKHKPDAPNGQLPYLTLEDGTKLPQSLAMSRFLAREHGLVGETNLEAAQADVVVDNAADLFKEVMKVVFSESDEEKAKAKKNAVENLIPAAMASFTRILKENGTGYVAGKSLTWADLVLSGVVHQLGKLFGDDVVTVDKYPELVKHQDRIMNIPQIKEYVANRKETEM